MRGKLVIGLIVSLAVISFGATLAFAECPEGKSPVNITTPSGKTKTLCIPATAVEGIENAAEHSGGTISTAVCPCYNLDDIIYFRDYTGATCFEENEDLTGDGELDKFMAVCEVSVTVGSPTTLGYSWKGLYYGDGVPRYQCGILVDPIDFPDLTGYPKSLITEEEYEACTSIMKEVIYSTN